MIYLVCFDVSDDRQRRKVVKVLEEFGRRIQFSVFELEMNPADYLNLKTSLKKLQLDRDDKCFIFPIDDKCINRAFYMGHYVKIERVYVF